MALFVMEIAVRIWNPPIADPDMVQIHRASPFLGWELVPGSSGIGSLGESYHINSAGFRDTEHGTRKQPGVNRIMVIGDSFTFGMSVNLNETYPKQLERILNHTNITCEVINCGVIGYNMWQHCEMLERKVLPYQPDFVILGLFEDDLGSSIPPYNESDGYQGKNPFENRGVSGVTGHLSLWNFLRNANALFEHKYRSRRGHTAVNRFVEQACREIGVPFVDVTPTLEVEEDRRSLYLFPFDAHNSPKGLRLIAQAIANKIISLHLLSPEVARAVENQEGLN